MSAECLKIVYADKVEMVKKLRQQNKPREGSFVRHGKQSFSAVAVSCQGILAVFGTVAVLGIVTVLGIVAVLDIMLILDIVSMLGIVSELGILSMLGIVSVLALSGRQRRFALVSCS